MTDESPVRRRMIEGAGRLFTRQGYAATSMRGIVHAAGTPWGSVHHYFPGGKQQVAVAAVELGDQRIRGAIDACLSGADGPADAVRAYFALVAGVLRDSGFEHGCPVATVALETASEAGPVTASCAASFAAWEERWATAFREAGVARDRAAELGTLTVAAVEGALLLGRVAHSTDPLRVAAEATASLIDAAVPV